MHGLESGGDITHFPRPQRLDRFHAWSEDSDLNGAHVDFRGEHAQDVGGFQRSFDNTDIGNDTFIRVIMRIEDEGAQRNFICILRRRDACDDGFEDLFNVKPLFGRDLDHVERINPEQRTNIFGYFIGAR
jgi:hypothetical protein